jgi:hypothetical protein
MQLSCFVGEDGRHVHPIGGLGDAAARPGDGAAL